MVTKLNKNTKKYTKKRSFILKKRPLKSGKSKKSLKFIKKGGDTPLQSEVPPEGTVKQRISDIQDKEKMSSKQKYSAMGKKKFDLMKDKLKDKLKNKLKSKMPSSASLKSNSASEMGPVKTSSNELVPVQTSSNELVPVNTSSNELVPVQTSSNEIVPVQTPSNEKVSSSDSNLSELVPFESVSEQSSSTPPPPPKSSSSNDDVTWKCKFVKSSDTDATWDCKKIQK